MSLPRPVLLAAGLLLAGCAATPAPTASTTQAPGGAAGGRYYRDDGPGANPPPRLAETPDAVPKAEPLHRYANRPYVVFNREYLPFTELRAFRERGTASWYGRRFHGERTASGEVYDMYSMSAAHPRLPIPSYARVTNPANGRSVVVRVNDRGPFYGGRVIDLSYAAALRLGFVEAGSAEVAIESIVPGTVAGAAAPQPPPAAAPASQAATEGEPAAGFYLQLGAFAARENAQALRLRVQPELARLGETLNIVVAGPLFKLRSGPYRTQDEARRAAARIEAELNLAPMLVSR